MSYKFKIGTVRFTDQTYQNNLDWKIRKNWKGCCYGFDKLMPNSINIGDKVYIIEMNNSINEIMGIGLIRNHNRADKRYCIYSDGNYNRYNYRSDYRIDRAEFKKNNNSLLELLELLVFKGYTHLKRGQGIQLVKKKKYKEIESKFSKEDVLNMIKNLFIMKYSN